jgi:hypothetical protein
VKRIVVPEGGSWLEPADMAACPTNNNPTIPVGTGDFQATLTWVNTESKSADLDLHLYGPNNLHVYWASSQSSDGTLQLDRDWLNDTGSAVENIFSDANFANGDYRLTVKHFSGSLPINFSVRVLLNGASNTYQRSFVSNKQEIEIFRFNK